MLQVPCVTSVYVPYLFVLKETTIATSWNFVQIIFFKIILLFSIPLENVVCYLSKSFIAFLVPAVEILSGIEHKGLPCFYMSELTIWEKRQNERSQKKTKTHICNICNYNNACVLVFEYVCPLFFWQGKNTSTYRMKQTELDPLVFDLLISMLSQSLYLSVYLFPCAPSLCHPHLAGTKPVDAAAFFQSRLQWPSG